MSELIFLTTLTALFFGGVNPTFAAPIDAKAVLDKVEKNVSSNDEVVTVQMTIIEASGDKKERKVEMRRKGQPNKQAVLVKLLSPADQKGITLLSKSEGKESDVWLFMPSSKQVRRIVSSGKGGSFQGSELSFEDMEAGSDAKIISKVIGREKLNGQNHILIENKSSKGESIYGKTVIWVEEARHLVSKIEYFDKKNQPLKVSTFSGYKKFGGTWRAQLVDVRNLQNKRGTTLALLSMKVNQGLSDGEFTESSLSEGD